MKTCNEKHCGHTNTPDFSLKVDFMESHEENRFGRDILRGEKK